MIVSDQRTSVTELVALTAIPYIALYAYTQQTILFLAARLTVTSERLSVLKQYFFIHRVK